MSRSHHTHAHHAPGRVYVFLLAFAIFGALSRCDGGPDYAPARAWGAERQTPAQRCLPLYTDEAAGEPAIYFGCIPESDCTAPRRRLHIPGGDALCLAPALPPAEPRSPVSPD